MINDPLNKPIIFWWNFFLLNRYKMLTVHGKTRHLGRDRTIRQWTFRQGSMTIPILRIFFPLLFFAFCTSADSSVDPDDDDADADVLVDTSFGTLRGKRQLLVDHVDGERVDMNVFLGVPYARPPIGKLRFEKPVKPKQWKGTTRNATEMAPACWPIVPGEMWTDPDKHSEDCLYLNIFAPAQKSPETELLPVLVFIHGGGFQSGTIREYKPRMLAKFVRHGLVVVTVQYRLAMFGFAATGAESFAGNYGLWDLVQALHFLRDQIAHFGGDPARVTLWGFSAGSAAVGHLAMSPHGHGLFKNAIQQSGSVFGEWALSNRVIRETERLATAVGCTDAEQLQDSEKLKQYLRTKTPQQLMDSVLKMGHGRVDLNYLQFHPRLDADFFPDDAEHLIEKAPPKRTLIGVASQEALSFSLFPPVPSLHSLHVTRERWHNFGRADFLKFVRDIVAPESAFGEQAAEVRKRIVEFYGAAEAESEGLGPEEWLAKYTELMTDVMFLVPTLLEARHKGAAGWPVHLYQIDHVNSGYPEDYPVKGSPHGVELYPVFVDVTFPYKVEHPTDDDRAFQQHLLLAIVNFAKHGDPSIPDVLPYWPPLSTDRPLRFAQLNAHPEMRQALTPKKLAFWRKLGSDFPFDIVRGIHRLTLRAKDEL